MFLSNKIKLVFLKFYLKFYASWELITTKVQIVFDDNWIKIQILASK